MNIRFNKVNIELLLCMACLDPRDSFSTFDKIKLLRFVEFYPSNFSTDLSALDNYILDVGLNDQFVVMTKVIRLAKKIVQLKKYCTYPLIYILIKLTIF